METQGALSQPQTEAQSVEKAFWPEPFLDGGRLADARARITGRVGAGDHRALALMLALGQLRLALSTRSGDQDKMVGILDDLGVAAYRFWKTEPGQSAESTFDSAQSWAADLNKLLASDNPHNFSLSVRIIMPKAGYDMETMLSEQSLTGSTSRVREPRSWIVTGTIGDHQRILAAGKVITE